MQNVARNGGSRAVRRAGRPLRIAGRETQRVHMSVGFTAEQHEWLRREAFAARVTPAELLRRQVAAVALTVDGDGGGAVVTPSATDRPWRRMTIIFGADQHDWLRERAFLRGVGLAAVVRGCVDVARRGAEPETAAPLPVSAARSAAAPRRLGGGEVTHMTVALPRELHGWLRRRAYEERTTAAELVRCHLAEARQRFDAAPPVRQRSH